MSEKKQPKPTKSKTYWSEETEYNLILFQTAEDLETRNKIYYNSLHKPLTLLVRGVLFSKKYRHIEDKVDLEKQCLSHLYTTLSKFKLDSGTKSFSYFTKIAINYISNIAWHKKANHIVLREIYNTDEPDTALEIQEHEIDKEEMLANINNALHILAAHERSVFDMYFTQSMSYDSIALHFGLSPGSIHNIIRGIRLKLKKHLGATLKMHRLIGTRQPKKQKNETQQP